MHARMYTHTGSHLLTCYKQVLWGKNSWGCWPNVNYLLSSFASQDTTTCQNNATTKAWAHTVSFRHGHTDTRCINFSFFQSFLILSCTKQSGYIVMDMLYCLATLYFCVQDINTLKNAVTCTQGHSSMCLVKAEENSFEYKQRSLLAL